MPGGRPTKYDPEKMIPIMDQLASEGAGVVEIAVGMGVCMKTFYNFKNEHDEFLQAFLLAKVKCQAWWERQGRRLDGGDLNHALWKLNMVNRFPDDWADKKEVVNEHSGGVMMVPLASSATEWTEEARSQKALKEDAE